MAYGVKRASIKWHLAPFLRKDCLRKFLQQCEPVQLRCPGAFKFRGIYMRSNYICFWMFRNRVVLRNRTGNHGPCKFKEMLHCNSDNSVQNYTISMVPQRKICWPVQYCNTKRSVLECVDFKNAFRFRFRTCLNFCIFDIFSPCRLLWDSSWGERRQSQMLIAKVSTTWNLTCPTICWLHCKDRLKWQNEYNFVNTIFLSLSLQDIQLYWYANYATYDITVHNV